MAVSGRVEDEVVSARVDYFPAGEGFLEIGKTSPGVVIWGALGSDAPEIESLLPRCGSIFDELDSKDAGSVKLAALFVLGTLEVVASSAVVENEASSDDSLDGSCRRLLPREDVTGGPLRRHHPSMWIFMLD